MDTSETTLPMGFDRASIVEAATDPSVVSLRMSLARFASEQFKKAGDILHVVGHVWGTDRKTGASPFGHGSDEYVGIAVVLLIASELTECSANLFEAGQSYAAAALLRQMVELEYLAWAFEARDHDAEKWLRSDKNERQEFFKPSKLRDAAKGRFRGKDYGYHCELGGHPTPQSLILLENDALTSQLLLSDLLGHVGRIWDHIAGWARENKEDSLLAHHKVLVPRFIEWKSRDLLTRLPPPP